MQHGFIYFIAIMDWYSRKILSYIFSNTLEKEFCIEALEEAIQEYGTPDIFNTDQGSQFNSNEFISVLKTHNISISMDGKCGWIDNVFIERFWRTLKYRCVYLHNFNDVKSAKITIQKFIGFDNENRPHSTFDGQTFNEIYYGISNINITKKVA